MPQSCAVTAQPVHIRVRPWQWAPQFLFLIPLVMTTVLSSGRVPDWWVFVVADVALGLLFAAWSVRALRFGIVLTPPAAVVQDVRRRVVPWQQISGVRRVRRGVVWLVQLVLDDGSVLSLRAPTRWGRIGQTSYDRDFHQIGQWWLAHRLASDGTAPT